MAKISHVSAHMIFDSRGDPTVEVIIALDNDIVVTASSPSGVSRSGHEAVELRDGDEAHWDGKGVNKAIDMVNHTVAQALIGIEAHDQQKIDKTLIHLDSTPNKSKLGTNATTAVSLAAAKAGAASTQKPLPLYIRSLLVTETAQKIPTPIFNIIEGGKHASNGLNFQEFLIIPAASKSFEEKMKIGVDIYKNMQRLLLEKSMATSVADEGGFAPDVVSNIEAFNIIKAACERSEYKFSLDVFAGVDAASTTFFGARDKHYKLLDKAVPLSQKELADFYKTLFGEYGMLYFEDPFAEDDLEGWKLMAELLPKTIIAGDDLTATSPVRLQEAIENSLINTVLVKPNQIGTVTETIAFVEMARFVNMKIVVSDRAGETNDEFLADFALGISADYVKFGAPARERTIKYNRLLVAKGFVEER